MNRQSLGQVTGTVEGPQRSPFGNREKGKLLKKKKKKGWLKWKDKGEMRVSPKLHANTLSNT